MGHERLPLRKLLQTAADPALASGASERIAGNAWARAAELRREAAAVPAARRIGRRLALPFAAAAVAVAGLVLAVRASAPAFAVEGDPVQVLRGENWTQEASRVPVGRWIFVPQGARTSVRGRDGSVIDPKPGAVFRIVGTVAPSAAWRVELRSGDAEVAGRTLVLTLSNAMEVAHTADVDTGMLRVAASFGAALDTPPLVGSADTVADGAPGVRVLDGTARVANLRGADFLLLRPQQSATCIRTDDGDGGAATTRLLRETTWSPDLAVDLLRGARVVGAAERGAGSFTFAISLPGAGDRAVFVPQGLRREVCDQIGLLSMQAAVQVRIGALAEFRHGDGDGDVSAEYEHTTAGGACTTRIVVDGGGRATLVRAGAAPRSFASLDDLRRDAPEAASLFGDKLR